MPRVSWTDAGLLDVERLYGFLYDHNANAAAAAAESIFAGTEQLAMFPESGREAVGRPADERELLIPFGASGYVVLYRVIEGGVLILAVRHMRQRGY